jgi:hypothetical protein
MKTFFVVRTKLIGMANITRMLAYAWPNSVVLDETDNSLDAVNTVELTSPEHDEAIVVFGLGGDPAQAKLITNLRQRFGSNVLAIELHTSDTHRIQPDAPKNIIEWFGQMVGAVPLTWTNLQFGLIGAHPVDQRIKNQTMLLSSMPNRPLLLDKQNARAELEERFGVRLAEPVYSVLLGDTPDTPGLVKKLQEIKDQGGSIVITTSRRSDRRWNLALAEVSDIFYDYKENDDRNPINAVIAAADRYILSPDSISMPADVLGNGRPVTFWNPPQAVEVMQRAFPLQHRYVSALLNHRYASNFTGADTEWLETNQPSANNTIMNRVHELVKTCGLR